MKIINKRISAFTLALLLPFLMGCNKEEKGIVLGTLDLIYAKDYLENMIDKEEYEGYLKEDATLYDEIWDETVTVEQYQKVKTDLRVGENVYIYTDEGNEGYIKDNQIERLPDDYVEVDISDQSLNLYQNHELILKTDVVTGKNETPTNLGYYEIDYKATNVVLKGPGYASPVTYWMPFNGSEGLHDATWRYSFGGDIYEYDGSHGCVNMQYDDARTVYNNVESGTKVLVHK